MIYLDTSYLVRLYFDDPGFGPVRNLAISDHVSCAEHGQSETIAAFHRKYREGAIPLKSYRALLAQFEADLKEGAIQWLPCGAEVLQRVRDTYSRLPASVYLRAADALHLASAVMHGHQSIYSNDAHLLAAARYFDLKGVNLIPQP